MVVAMHISMFLCSDDWRDDCRKPKCEDYDCSYHVYDKHINCLQTEVQIWESSGLDKFFDIEKEKHDIYNNFKHDVTNGSRKSHFRYWSRVYLRW